MEVLLLYVVSSYTFSAHSTMAMTMTSLVTWIFEDTTQFIQNQSVNMYKLSNVQGSFDFFNVKRYVKYVISDVTTQNIFFSEKYTQQPHHFGI